MTRRVAVLLTILALPGTAGAAEPIRDLVPTTAPEATGAPHTAQAYPRTTPPRNPFLARDPVSNIHTDSWMTDAYAIAGPLGRNLQATSGSMPPALCGSLTFDRKGHVVSVCPSFLAPVTARVIDAQTLDILATYEMPGGPNQPGPGAYQNFTGGGYFFLDQQDRIWSAAKTNQLLVLRQSDDSRSLTKVAEYDLTSALTDDEKVTSALPDYKGRIWFVSKQNGKVGVLNTRTRRINVLRLGEEVQNSFAVDRKGVYIASDKRMYRFWTDRRGKPRVQWSAVYENSGIVKPSQVNAGTGTTPTIMKGGYVAITDNADPMNVVVYRTARKLRRGQRREVCAVPVFEKGASATENSLMTAGRSLFVENNYGYQDPFGPRTGEVTTPGFARVDVNANGRGCRLVWTNTEVRAPSVVPKLSTKTGLIYAYERAAAPPGQQPWYWVAIDARTGRTVWRRYAGSGLSFNNNYAGLAIGPDGSAYLGVLGGMLRLRDG